MRAREGARRVIRLLRPLDVVERPDAEAEDAVVRDPKKHVSHSVVNAIGEGGFSRVMLVRAKSGHIDAQADKPPR